jgi:hypothetical protein
MSIATANKCRPISVSLPERFIEAVDAEIAALVEAGDQSAAAEGRSGIIRQALSLRYRIPIDEISVGGRPKSEG